MADVTEDADPTALARKAAVTCSPSAAQIRSGSWSECAATACSGRRPPAPSPPDARARAARRC